MYWTKAELVYLNNRDYEFDNDPYKYGYKKSKEVKTIDEIYAAYPKLKDKLEGRKDKGKERKKRKTKRKSKG